MRLWLVWVGVVGRGRRSRHSTPRSHSTTILYVIAPKGRVKGACQGRRADAAHPRVACKSTRGRRIRDRQVRREPLLESIRGKAGPRNRVQERAVEVVRRLAP
jgi:hypothetical protein